MNARQYFERIQKSGMAMLLLLLLALSGCGSSDTLNYTEPYRQKVYLIGEIKPPTSSATDQITEVRGVTDTAKQIFVNRVAYDGVATDAPIFIAADRVNSLNETTRTGIRDTYRNGNPIIIIHGGEAEINILLGVAGLDQNYKQPAGFDYAELFAIDREESGASFTWIMYPPRKALLPSGDENSPDSGVFQDSYANQSLRTMRFSNWISNNGKRTTSKLSAVKREASLALAAATTKAGSSLNLEADPNETTIEFMVNMNLYSLNYWVISWHTFNAADAAGYDWFYVRQEGILNASGNYSSSIVAGGGMEENRYYVGSYMMNNWINGLTYQKSGVTLQQPNPENANGKTEVESSVEYEIGGSVGFEGKSPTAELSIGATLSNSSSFEVSDCEVKHKSGDQAHNAHWEYEFRRSENKIDILWTRLTTPPVLARETFLPVNQWIWKMAPSVRDSGKNSFESEFDATYITSRSGLIIVPYLLALPVTHTVSSSTIHGPEHFNIALRFPPLLVSLKNVDFSAAAQSRAIDFAVSRSWTASSDQSWCRVNPLSGPGDNPHVNITVDKNDTGKFRTASITFKTQDGKGTSVTTVNQTDN